MAPQQIALEFAQASNSQREWATLSLEQRTRRVEAMVAAVAADDEIAKDITLGMGKPYEQVS